MLFWLAITGFFEAIVVLQGWFAWCDEFLTPAQMRRGGIREGLPFLAHGGMWGDFFFISPLMAWIFTFHDPWPMIGAGGVALFFGLVASIAMHETYKKAPFPEAHVQNGQLTDAGRMHRAYMAVALAMLSQYYISAPYTPWMWLVSALLTLHTVAGTHVVLGLMRPPWFPGRPLQNPQTWGVIGGTAVLTFGCAALRALFSN